MLFKNDEIPLETIIPMRTINENCEIGCELYERVVLPDANIEGFKYYWFNNLGDDLFQEHTDFFCNTEMDTICQRIIQT